jgi:hypothetical protein
MICPAQLPITVEIPEDYTVSDAAVEAIALLLIEAAEGSLAAERDQTRDAAI